MSGPAMMDALKTHTGINRSGAESALPSDAPHILVIDDDRRIRELIRSYLTDNGFRVSATGSAAEAREHMRGLEFDLLVLDVMMPGETGLDFARSLRGSSDVPILMLTARTETDDRIAGLEAGVDDYLPKPFEPRELVLRINSVLRRQMPAAAARTEIAMGQCRFHIERGELKRDGVTVRLTTRERDLLRIFAANAGKAIGRNELAADATGSGARAVDVQINRLRRKIEPDPANPVYLQTVRGAGYILYTD
jgi:two-component system phosphate regulon response regulator OmpR